MVSSSRGYQNIMYILNAKYSGPPKNTANYLLSLKEQTLRIKQKFIQMNQYTVYKYIIRQSSIQNLKWNILK